MKPKLKLRNKALLPNEHNFKFVGVKTDGTYIDCTVNKGEDGCHYIKEIPVSKLKGWFTYTELGFNNI